MTDHTQHTMLQLLLDNDQAHANIKGITLPEDVILNKQAEINLQTLEDLREKLPDLWPQLETKFTEAYKDLTEEKLLTKAQLLNDHMYKNLDEALNMFANLVVVDKKIREIK